MKSGVHGEAAGLSGEAWASRLFTIGIEAECEKQLSGRTRDIRLEGTILARYQSWSWSRRAKVVRAWMLWVAILNIFLTILGSLLIPALLIPSVVLMGLIVPAANFAVRYLWARPRGRIVEPLSLISVTIMTMVAYGALGAILGSSEQERYITAGLFLAAIALVVFDMVLVWSIALSLCALLVFGFFQLSNPNISFLQSVFSSAFFGLGVLVTIEARRTANTLAYKGFLLSVRDTIQKRALAEANQNLQRLATLDPLTGIANRRSMEDHTDHLWQDPSVNKTQIAVIMADIDHFKRLNDAFGHAVGGACIRQVAEILVASTRKDFDLVSRYGGEEFLVVLTEASEEAVMAIAERIRGGVESLKVVDCSGAAVVLSVTISIGVATASDGVDAELLSKWADDALYEAKRLGRNRVCRSLEGSQSFAAPDALADSSAVSFV